jgi:hypothetical protein
VTASSLPALYPAARPRPRSSEGRDCTVLRVGEALVGCLPEARNSPPCSLRLVLRHAIALKVVPDEAKFGAWPRPAPSVASAALLYCSAISNRMQMYLCKCVIVSVPPQPPRPVQPSDGCLSHTRMSL